MGKGELATRNYLKDKKRFADFFNGTVFQGEQVVQPDNLTACDTRTGIIIPEIKKGSEEVERYRDIAMTWNDEARLVILACENQAKVHYAMPLRTMLYDGITYTEQAADIWKERPQEKVTSAEFLSQFRKEDKLVPVITLVFYYGSEEWDASISLHEMLDMKGISEKMIKYIPNYHINLVVPNGSVDKKLFR